MVGLYNVQCTLETIIEITLPLFRSQKQEGLEKPKKEFEGSCSGCSAERHTHRNLWKGLYSYCFFDILLGEKGDVVPPLYIIEHDARH